MILIDGDIMLYNSIHKTSINVEFDGEWIGPYLDLRQARARIDLYVKGLQEKLDDKGDHKVVVAWSDHDGCFRHDIDPSYKQNRTGKKPGGWFELESYVDGVYHTERMPLLEADDVLGILATQKANRGSIIVSDDKDLQTIPSTLYRPRQGELLNVTTKEADLYHLQQALEGDRVDDYPGCPGVGAVGAKRLLAPLLEEPRWIRAAKLRAWDTVVAAFEKKGLTEQDALVQARLARILRSSEWDDKTRKPLPWNPGQ